MAHRVETTPPDVNTHEATRSQGGDHAVKLLAAAIQMPTELGASATNLDRADSHLHTAWQAGATVAVLPEMVNTGYGLMKDYSPIAETRDGRFLSHLRDRCREWGMMIAAGFVELDGHHLYDAMALVLPDGGTHVYRKRHLVFWEPYHFSPGRDPVIVDTPFGRVGLAICADMIYERVWNGFRDKIDLALISSAWPEFRCRAAKGAHWLFGYVGTQAGSIPARVANDLKVPVVFANQCGATKTIIPFVGTWLRQTLDDRFAGASRICDGLHPTSAMARDTETVLLSEITLHPSRGPRSCRSMSPSGFEAGSFGSDGDGSLFKPPGSMVVPDAVGS